MKSTQLTADFMLENFGQTFTFWSSKERQAKFADYYFNICAAVNGLHYLQPVPAQIETFLSDGEVAIKGEKIKCAVEDEADRKHLFLTAQAKQLMYDISGGRGSMLRGEDRKHDLCRDALARLDMLGLVQRTMFVK